MVRRSRLQLVVFALVLLNAPASAAVLTVNSTNLQGWTLTTSGAVGVPPPAAYLAPGYETPPLGIGSVRLTPGQDGAQAAQARHNGYAGTRIDALTALSYSTFVEVDGSGGQAPYLILNIDFDGNGTSDDLWFFEPVYQSAGFFPANPQGPLVTDTWQTWDARAGGWWSLNGIAGATPGAGVKSITQLLAAQPNATIATSAAGGSVRIVTGFGAGAWDKFIGAADNFRIATAANDTTYDFEPDALTTITVTPSQLETWTLTTTNANGGVFGASSTIVTGPGTPPMGTGSLQLAVGPDGDDSAEARTNRFDGLFLRDLTELDYSAYHQSGGSGGQMAYIILRVDYDNNGTQDDLLFFEPVYQTAAFCPSNPQPAVASGVWQTWEAANGCWWSLNGTAGATPGVGVKPLASILAAQPDAALSTGTAAVRIVAGFGAGAWDNFIGNVDAFNISFATSALPRRTIYDFDPDPAISIADLTQNEGNAGATPFNFNVTLDKPVSYTVTVQYSTADNTATIADADYVAASLATVTFAPYDVSEPAPVTVNGDTKFEPTETFFVNLSNPSVGATIADNQAIGTITNDDPQPTISISDVTQVEGNAGATNFTFTVALSNPSSATITVDYATAPGTATAGTDYASTGGTLTFVPTVVAQQITVSVLGDTVFEPNETFFVNLTNPTNATIADNQGLGTITNDDVQPAISINDVTLAEGNAGTTNFVFTVTLSNPSASTVTVDFATADGTATAGSDYTASGGSVTFVPLATTQQITVAVTGDLLFEPNETFFVNLTNPTNATIADNQGLGTITNDEGQPTISITDVTLAEGNAGTTAFVFTVTLSGASASTTTVDFATANGTAAAGSDYTAAAGTVTFNPGVVSQPITVNVLGDLVFEPNETFVVNLTNAINATIADNQGLGTITNDEGAVADVSIVKTGPAFAAVNAPVSYTITVSNAGPQPATSVTVSDTIPAGTTFVSATPSQGSCSGTTTVVCSIGTLGLGASATIQLVVTAPSTNGTISNTATVTAVESDPVVANNSSTTAVQVLTAGEIPTMSEWMLMALAMALAGLAMTKIGRQ